MTAAPTQIAPPPLMSERDAAAYLGLMPNTLSHWRVTGRYALPYRKIGRYVRYHLADLDRWLESRTRGAAPSDDAE